jgi:tetratricopeptide (TPR) repeat protein
VVERAALLSDGPVIGLEYLDLSPSEEEIEPTVGNAAEAVAILAALEATRWNISQTAARLGIPRSTLRYRMTRHALGRSSPPVTSQAGCGELSLVALVRVTRERSPRWDAANVATTDEHLAAAAEKLRGYGGRIEWTPTSGFTAIFGLDAQDSSIRTLAGALCALLRGFRATEAGTRALVHAGRFPGPAQAQHAMEALLPATAAHPVDRVLLSPAATSILRRHIAVEPGNGGLHILLGSAFFGGEHRHMAPLFGRSIELEMLVARLQAALAGRTQLVGIQGEAGMGKSRMLGELRRAAVGRGFGYVQGVCVPHARGIPYQPIIDLFRGLCGICDAEPASVIAAKAHAYAERIGLDEALRRALLGAFGLSAPGPAAAPEVAQARLRELLRRALAAECEVHPLLVAFEDVHWIDPASRESLELLARSMCAAPLVIAATYRPEHQPTWMTGVLANQISLLPLSREESAALALANAPRGSLANGVIDSIVARAEGNPFFLEELALAASKTGTAALPDSVRDVVSSRIHALRPRARRVLTTAAILGRECPLALLTALSSDIGHLEPHIEELERQAVAHVRGQSAPILELRHALVQEVAYGLVPADERRTLHGAAARALEAQHAGRMDDVWGLLAHHYTRGDDPERAVDVLIQALAKAVGTNAMDAAAELLDTALGILATLAPTEANRRRRLDLLLSEPVAALFIYRARPDEHWDLLRHLESDVEEVGTPLCRALFFLQACYCHWWVGRFPEAMDAGRHAVAAFRAGGASPLAVYGVTFWCVAATGTASDMLALEAEALAEAERSPHLRWSTYVYSVFSWTRARLGRADEAVRLVEEVFRRWPRVEADDPSSAAFAHWWLAKALADAGDLARARLHVEKAVAGATTANDREWAECVQGMVRCRMGEVREGTALIEAGLRGIRRKRFVLGELVFGPSLGEGYFRMGDLSRSREVFTHLLACAEAHGMPHLEAVACTWLGAIDARRREPQAERFAQRARGIFDRMGIPQPHPDAKVPAD